MQINIESQLNNKSIKLVNALTSIKGNHAINEIETFLKNSIKSFNLQNNFVCGSGSDHVWLSHKNDGERILIITE